MIPKLRKKFNNEFTQKKYEDFLEDLNSILKYPTDFRVSETPLFLSDEFKNELIKACNELVKQIQTKEFKDKSQAAIPPGLAVPNETEHPVFLQIDFAVCKDEEGNYIPKLIELQGFPSLYGFQYFLAKKVEDHFDIPSDFTPYFSGLNSQSYIQKLKDVMIGKTDPKNVILLEIQPEKQKTRIDFAATEKLLGLNTVDITKVIKKNDKLFYTDNGKEIRIERIYNRVIFDELIRTGINYSFDLTKPLDVKWIGHPNWFFKISKHSLPSLTGKYVPKCFFINQLKEIPEDLHNYVLKPLYSFAGLGVEVELTKKKLNLINDKNNYILQEKIEYAPLIETPDGYSKVEIRMMILWDDNPILVNNLVRMSKGKMMGVDFNKNKTWVGSNSAFHRVNS
ncbi:MAG: hypothetical protein ABI550_06785 [Ignavibacteriaceae bacterium]